MRVTRRDRIVIGGALCGLVVLGFVLGQTGTGFDPVQELANDPVRFALAMVGLYLIRPIFVWPTTPLAALVGWGLGITSGIPIALAGVILTTVPVYLTLRLLDADDPARGRVRRVIGQYYQTAGPTRGVMASRLAPIPSDIATVAAALSDVSPRQFIIGTALGELPWTIAAVIVGATAGLVLAEGLTAIGPSILLVGLVAAGLVLADPAYRAVRSHANH
ncbi:MAG: VTT domain-containing protein [Natrialbaceae archaeon]|nr:VTT domain-containing protein [Natrialbaceae archaeon]